MKPVDSKFRSFEEAEAANREYYRRLSPANGWRSFSSFAPWCLRRSMPLPEDWRALIESLNSHGVEYMVVGALARWISVPVETIRKERKADPGGQRSEQDG